VQAVQAAMVVPVAQETLPHRRVVQLVQLAVELAVLALTEQ
jgi:hypothetical protein